MTVSGKYYIKKRMPKPELLKDAPRLPPEDLEMRERSAPPPGPKMPEISLPDHGPCLPGSFEGEVFFDLKAQPDGTLTGTANGEPIKCGSYTGEEFIKVTYSVGSGTWEICARIDKSGSVEGIVSVSGDGHPNLAYGTRLDCSAALG